MRNLLWFVFGLAGGFVAAHYVNKDPRGHELLAEVDGRISQFADRIGDAYREQEARIAGLVNEAAERAGAAVADAAQHGADVVSTAANAVSDATKKLSD